MEEAYKDSNEEYAQALPATAKSPSTPKPSSSLKTAAQSDRRTRSDTKKASSPNPEFNLNPADLKAVFDTPNPMTSHQLYNNLRQKWNNEIYRCNKTSPLK